MSDLTDRIKDKIEDAVGADLDAEHAWGNGFDRSVCRGCRFDGRVMRGAMEGCELCGCPHVNLDTIKGGSPPAACPRLDEHARRG